MSSFNTQNTHETLIGIALIMLVTALLYLGQEIFIPLALAVLLSFLLTPLLNRLERWHLPRIPSVLVVTLLTSALLAGLGFVVANQLVGLVDSLPQYKENIRERVRSLRASGSGGIVERTKEIVKEVQEEVQQAAPQTAQPQPGEAPAATSTPLPTTPKPSGKQPAGETQGVDRTARLDRDWLSGLEDRLINPTGAPIPVEVRAPPPSTFQLLQDYLTPLLEPLARAGIVIVFVIFILIQREDLRDRVIRLLGQGHLDLTTRALDEASSRISRYLNMQLLINISYGVPVGIGLWLMGLPAALLWGLLATVLRFIPYIGPWLAAALPILLSLAVFEGWYWPLMVIGLFVVLELFTNNVLEPWLYGSSTGLSPLAVLVAAVFWSWLWGGVGLLLAIPLTVCLLVIGKYMPQLEFLTILLSQEPALPPGTQFYQRVLAMDDDEALELAGAYREKHGLVKVYDEIVVAALQLEESDRHAGRLDDERKQLIRQTMQGIIKELSEWPYPEPDTQGEPKPTTSSAEAAATPRYPVLCLPARDEADELTGQLFTQLLQGEGFDAEALSVMKLSSEMIERVRETGATWIVISALPPGAVTSARYLCKRLKRELPGLQIIVGLWGAMNDFDRVTRRLTEAGASSVVNTFKTGLEQIHRVAEPASARSPERALEAPAAATT